MFDSRFFSFLSAYSVLLSKPSVFSCLLSLQRNLREIAHDSESFRGI